MSSPIFNSLGSNYTDALLKVASEYKDKPTKAQSAREDELKERLGNHFDGDVILTYKGRDAIELALRPITDGKVQQGILTQGLACHAIEEGILRAGMVPVYCDLRKQTLGPSVHELEEGVKRAKDLGVTVSAVFLQHTLGYANEVKKIATFCAENEFVLIEDLAQSFGAADEDGVELGTYADIVIFSFGRDKVIDAVSGGAVCFKKSFWEKIPGTSAEWIKTLQPIEFPQAAVVHKELSYPGLTSLIRKTHSSGLGKLIFKAAKSLGFLTSPIAAAVDTPTCLPAGYIAMALSQLEQLEDQLEHRRQIAEIYLQELGNLKGAKCFVDPKRLNTDIHLRVPLLFDDPEVMKMVMNVCTHTDIHITDRWYREVVDSGSLHYQTLYKLGSCPEAEHTAARLLNLPTHVKITPEDAERISQTISDLLAKL